MLLISGFNSASTPVYVILTYIVSKLVPECQDSEILDGHRHEGWDLTTGFLVEGPKCKY